MSRQSTTRRLALAGLTAVALTASPLAATAATSSPPTPCDRDAATFHFDGWWEDVVTHRKGFNMAPHQTKTMTAEASFDRAVHTAATGKVEGSLSGSKLMRILVQAKLSVKGSFATDERESSHSSMSVTDTLKTNKKDGQYVSFAGYRVWHGTYRFTRCDRMGQNETVEDSGTWESFDPIARDGIALCPSTRYDARSLMAQACKQTWN